MREGRGIKGEKRREREGGWRKGGKGSADCAAHV